jgi:ABC-type transporter Mla subunit MlaD
MNAKETLKKIAEALNIVGDTVKEEVKETVENVKESAAEVAEAVGDVGEAIADAAEDAVEAVVEKATDVKEAVEEKVADAIDAVGDKLEEAGEALQQKAEEIDPDKDRENDKRVADLEKQLSDLKEILKNAMAEPKVEDTPEIPEEEPKGLTHSPEKKVSKKPGNGVGKKGTSIQERVFKYINNN